MVKYENRDERGMGSGQASASGQGSARPRGKGGRECGSRGKRGPPACRARRWTARRSTSRLASTAIFVWGRSNRFAIPFNAGTASPTSPRAQHPQFRHGFPIKILYHTVRTNTTSKPTYALASQQVTSIVWMVDSEYDTQVSNREGAHKASVLRRNLLLGVFWTHHK
jgi:hypothetical protein